MIPYNRTCNILINDTEVKVVAKEDAIMMCSQRDPSVQYHNGYLNQKLL